MLNNRMPVEIDDSGPEYEKVVNFPYWSKTEGKSFGNPYAFFAAPSSNPRNWFSSVWISSPIAEVPSFTNNGGNSNTGMFHTGQTHLDSSRVDGYACHRFWTLLNNKRIRAQNYQYGGQKSGDFDSPNQVDERQWWLAGSGSETTSASVKDIFINGTYKGTLAYGEVHALTTNPSGYHKSIGTFRYAGNEYPAQSFYGKMDCYFLCRREYITDQGLFSQYGITSDKNTWQNPFYETDGNIIYISDERKQEIAEELNARTSDCPWTIFIYMKNKGGGIYEPAHAGGISVNWDQFTNPSYYNLTKSTIPYGYI